MNDYRLTFPVTALVAGVEGIAALREQLQSETITPINALGDRRVSDGTIFVPDPNADINTSPPDTWYGRPGSAATSYTDLNGTVVQVPAKGDPALYYVHIRSEQEAGAFRPDRYEMTGADLTDSAAVLGIWLGDEAP
jgi:hypothetical protein